MLRNNTAAERVGLSIVGESGADPWTRMRSKQLLGSDSSVLQVCVLGLPCKDGNSIQNRLFLAEIETAWSLCHIE